MNRDPASARGCVFGSTALLALCASCSGPPPCAQAPPGTVVSESSGVMPPKLLHAPDVEYPQQAAEAGAAGTAVVRCVITAEGSVTACRVLRSVPMLDGAIVDALQKSRYTPPQCEANPVAMSHLFSVTVVPPTRDGEVPDWPALAKQCKEVRRPDFISGRNPIYTLEARRNRTEGLVAVRCVITTEGTLTACHVVKSLPAMDQSVLDALATHRYTPVLCDGKPTSMRYVFNIRLNVVSY